MRLQIHPRLVAVCFVSCMITLTACGSSGDDPIDASVATTDGGNAAPAAEGLGTPRYLTSDCGSLPISRIALTGILDQPTRLAVGEIGRGRIIPGSAISNENYWSLDLEAGNYHLVADVANATGERFAGLTVTEVGPTGEAIAPSLNDADDDYRVRAHRVLEVSEAKTVTLRIESPFDRIVYYTLGVFPDGSSVPSPYFETCPDIGTLSTGTTESLVASNDGHADAIAWYRLDANPGPYVIESVGRRLEGSAIAYTIEVWDHLGQNAARTRALANVSRGDVSLMNGDIDIDGPVWITVRGGQASTGVEFTVHPR